MKKTFTPMYKNQRSKISVSLKPVTAPDEPINYCAEMVKLIENAESQLANNPICKASEPTKAERVQELIDQAQGANEYIKTALFCKWIFHTDSLDEVCKVAGAFWVLDVIVSHLPSIIKRYREQAAFQVWTLKINRRKDGSIINARIACEDGDGNTLKAQIIPYTDFPLDEFKVFCEYGSLDGTNPAYIIMLPGDH